MSKNIRRKSDGTFIVNFRGSDFHVTPDYPTEAQYGYEWTFEAINKYAASHPSEVSDYIEPTPPTISEEEIKQARIAELTTESQKLIPYIQAGIDVDVNQQKLTDVMLEIEDLRGNL